VGVTTAYELAADGHSVTVFERRGSAAEETSFANAGVVAPGYVTPWAAPGMPWKVLQHLVSAHAPVRLAWPLSGAEMAWIWRWWRACQLQSYQKNRARLQRLAFYSHARLHELCAQLNLEYERSDGYLVLLRSPRDSRQAQVGLKWLREAGVGFKEVAAEEARRLEPGLNPQQALFGAIHLPQDEVGNCRQFALLLKNQAQALGASFEFDTVVASLGQPHATNVWIAGETQARSFDAVVVCAGLAGVELLKPQGLKLPMVAVHGYSITAPLREPLYAPRSGLMDERYKVAITRLGQRVRVAGSAEIGGHLQNKRDAALRTLYKVLRDWFPGAARLSSHAGSVQEWKGARPMLPDGPPVLGASGKPGLWLNLGHGSSGWALSCGSARVLADLVAGRKAAIDLEGLGLARLHR